MGTGRVYALGFQLQPVAPSCHTPAFVRCRLVWGGLSQKLRHAFTSSIERSAPNLLCCFVEQHTLFYFHVLDPPPDPAGPVVHVHKPEVYACEQEQNMLALLVACAQVLAAWRWRKWRSGVEAAQASAATYSLNSLDCLLLC